MIPTISICPVCLQMHEGEYRQCDKCSEEIDSDSNDYRERYESNIPLPQDNYNYNPDA